MAFSEKIDQPKRGEPGEWLKLRHAAIDLLVQIGVPADAPRSTDNFLINAFRTRLNLAKLKYSDERGLNYLKDGLVKTIRDAGGKVDEAADVYAIAQVLEKLVATEVVNGVQKED
jgi:hypothetical protein